MDQTPNAPKITVGTEAGQHTHAPEAVDATMVAETKVKKVRQEAAVVVGLTLLPILAYVVIMGGLSMMARNGESGTEFIALILFPFFLIIPALLPVSIGYLIRYLIKGKPGTFGKIIAILTILIFLSLLGWIAYGLSGKSQRDEYKRLTMSKQEAITLINECKVDGVSEGYGSIPPHLSFKSAHYSKKQYLHTEDLKDIDDAIRNAPLKCGLMSTSAWDNEMSIKALTVEELTQLLQACKVKQVTVYYTDNRDQDSLYNEGLNTTGIAAQVDKQGRAFRVEIRKDLKDMFLRLAYDVKAKTCPDLEIYRKEKNI